MTIKLKGTSAKSRRKPVKSDRHRELTAELMNFFYPIHYRIGMELETVMCQGSISRKQAAILWLIYSRAPHSGWMRRKEIERRLETWFEISNSNISKLLRELSKPPLSLIDQVENPDSGREKVIRLTKSGRVFVGGMISSAVELLSKRLAHLEIDELQWGVDFFALASPRRRIARENATGQTSKLSPPPGRISKEFQPAQRSKRRT